MFEVGDYVTLTGFYCDCRICSAIKAEGGKIISKTEYDSLVTVESLKSKVKNQFSVTDLSLDKRNKHTQTISKNYTI